MRYLFVFLAFPLCMAFAKDPDKTKSEVRTGYMAKAVLQHPNVASPFTKEKQDAFDVHINGKHHSQIIVLFPKGVKPPTDRKRKLELKGTIRKIDLGGKPGTKGSYKNEAMTVKTWRYIK